MTQTDDLVAAYLARVDRAASRLPAARREELLGDLREHIEIARAESAVGSEAEVRTILERLGDPESIVAAADTQTDLPAVTAPGSFPPAPPRPRSRTALWWGVAALAVLALLLVFATVLALQGASSSPVEQAVPSVPATGAAEVGPSTGP